MVRIIQEKKRQEPRCYESAPQSPKPAKRTPSPTKKPQYSFNMKTTSAAAVLGLAALSAAVPAKRQAPSVFPSAAPASSVVVSVVPSAVPSAAPSTQPTCIVQTVNDPSSDQIKASIDQWNRDVVAVNSFLNAAPGLLDDPTSLGTQASAALTNAQDEPCQLQTLSSVPGVGVPAFTCAVNDLTQGFGTNVLNQLQTIVNNQGDTASVQSAVGTINQFRCCNVLGDASILWLDTATDAGIADQVNTVAPQEDACNAISCTNMCGAMDNGSSGTPGDLTSNGGP